MGSEATAAAENQAAIRRDPMAMLPFCGYNMGTYWKHWLEFGAKLKNPPKIFRVNWFRKNDEGKFMWPGFGENMRVMQWIVDRVRSRVDGVQSPFGTTPQYTDLNWTGLDFSTEDFKALMTIPANEAKAEAEDQKQFFATMGTNLPENMEVQRTNLLQRLENAPAEWQPPQS